MFDTIISNMSVTDESTSQIRTCVKWSTNTFREHSGKTILQENKIQENISIFNQTDESHKELYQNYDNGVSHVVKCSILDSLV